MKIRQNQQYGMTRIETEKGTVFFRSKNGFFDAAGKQVEFTSMEQLIRFETEEIENCQRKLAQRTK